MFDFFRNSFLRLSTTMFNKDFIFTILSFTWRLISGPVTLIFIPILLSVETQGYWYTFLSLSALSIFADMGFTTIVTQFAAHEFAHLTINEDGVYVGEVYYLNRLGSLLRFIIKWSLLVSIIAFPVIALIGIIMFSSKETSISWLVPWMFFIFSSSIGFFINIVLSFFEGCNQIAKVQKNRFISSIINTIIIWMCLFLNLGLFSLSIAAIIGYISSLILLLMNFKNNIRQLLSFQKDKSSIWKKEFLRLIWKYALSWSSGYFIFQIYTPLMFQFHGSIYAGKVGISLSLCSAIFTLSNVWIYIKTPKLNMLASQKKWIGMDKILFNSVSMSIFTYILGVSIVFALYFVFGQKILFFTRFLGVVPMISLFASWLFQIVISGIATYLRAHKEEPLVIYSIVIAIYTSLSTYLIAKYLSADFLFLGLLSSYIFAIPWIIYIYIDRKRVWHI